MNPANRYGVLAPAGTPADILNTLNSHIAKIMQTPEMKQRMTDSGSLAVGSTREAFAAHRRKSGQFMCYGTGQF